MSSTSLKKLLTDREMSLGHIGAGPGFGRYSKKCLLSCRKEMFSDPNLLHGSHWYIRGPARRQGHRPRIKTCIFGVGPLMYCYPLMYCWLGAQGFAVGGDMTIYIISNTSHIYIYIYIAVSILFRVMKLVAGSPLNNPQHPPATPPLKSPKTVVIIVLIAKLRYWW